MYNVVLGRIHSYPWSEAAHEPKVGQAWMERANEELPCNGYEVSVLKVPESCMEVVKVWEYSYTVETDS